VPFSGRPAQAIAVIGHEGTRQAKMYFIDPRGLRVSVAEDIE
jgi:hypothetical protein